MLERRLYGWSAADEYWIVNVVDREVEVHRDRGLGRPWPERTARRVAGRRSRRDEHEVEVSAAWSLPPQPVPARKTRDDLGTRAAAGVGASSR